jgi:hypothetical protein
LIENCSSHSGQVFLEGRQFVDGLADSCDGQSAIKKLFKALSFGSSVVRHNQGCQMRWSKNRPKIPILPKQRRTFFP